MHIIKAAYPNYFRQMKKSEGDDLVNLWCFMFADADAIEVGNAVKEFIATDKKGFPPTVGNIKALMGAKALPESNAKLSEMKMMAERIRAEYHASGHISPLEALKQGITYSEWEAGLNEQQKQGQAW